MDPRAVVRAARQVVTLPQSSQPQGAGQQAAPNLEPWVGTPQPYPYVTTRSAVSIVKGESRRKNITDALVAIDDQIRPVLKTKKYVILKPNCVNQVPLGTTNAEALMGVLDYLAPRFKGPIVIAESSGNPMGNFEALGYPKIVEQHKDQHVTLVDLNAEARYEVITVFDYHAHVIPLRLAARLLDPDAYIICCAILKTHNTVVATLSLKNMALGAPLHNARADGNRWNDKRLYHGGVRQTHVDIALTAQKLQPYWGATVLDGWEGMEGNGPGNGTGVPSRIAVASTDYVAADRVGVEVMGINPDWIGYLGFCARLGLGQDDLSQIEIRGPKLADVTRKYRMHEDLERELRWMGPMEEVPEKLG
jgi:uncharacterized protein (DUF362 family)